MVINIHFVCVCVCVCANKNPKKLKRGGGRREGWKKGREREKEGEREGRKKCKRQIFLTLKVIFYTYSCIQVSKGQRQLVKSEELIKSSHVHVCIV